MSCVQTVVNGPGKCQCLRGYELVDGHCKSVPATERSIATTTNSMTDQKTNSGGIK